VKKARPDADWQAYCKRMVATGQEAAISRTGEGDRAAPMYEWLLDYGKRRKTDPAADLPAELREVDPDSFHFLQAAQFTGQMRFLEKAEGATDGWAQNVISHGWSIQHILAPPFDYEPGKEYTLYVRARATAQDTTADGIAMQAGFHVKPRGGARGGLPLAQADGRWHTLEIGTFEGPPQGGNFFVCLDTKTKSGVSNAQIDCLWLVEHETTDKILSEVL
jgi:hypothetical protein